MAILINDTAPRAQYTATSGQTVFTVSFEFFANSDLKVYRNATLLTLTTNYTVTGAGVTGGGSVTFVTGATAGDIVTIIRDVPVARTSDFPTSGPFNIEALNTDLDRLTAMVQQQETLDGRSLRLDQFDTPNTLNVLPVKASRVGRVLQFNDTTGQPEAGPTTSEIANAQTYATNASTSATAAAASASAASSSAGNASTSATNAASSASAASTSASNASSSASAASTSASNASTSASAAAASETAAAGSASTASTQASNAASSASAASTSASNASTSASNAATSASNASSSASAASASQVAAAASAAAAAASYDSFDDRYLGVKASDPTLDNDGNALVQGALYYNNTTGTMKVYDGANWITATSAGNTSLLNYRYVATTGQTTFSGVDANSATMSYTVNNIIVSRNGVILDPTDYTATSGTSVVLVNAASAGDNINIVAFKSFTTADMVPASTGGTYAGAVQFIAGSASTPGISVSGDANTGMFFPAADTIAFAEGGAEAMRIDSSGNVGIGTSSPQSSLHVAGTVSGAPTTTGIQMGINSGYAGIEMSNTTGGWLDFNKGDGTDFQGRLFYDNANNVMQFYTNGANERARIDSSGNLLVGTTGASGRLTSSSTGTVAVYASSTGNHAFFGDTGAAGFYGVYGTTSNASYGGTIGYHNGSGVFGILGYAGYGLYTNASISVNGTVYSSDARLKENVVPLTSALEKLSALNPVSFDWKAASSRGAVSDFGLIAQEVETVIPEAVFETNTPPRTPEMNGRITLEEELGSYKGVDYSRMIPFLIAGLQELKAQNDELKARITALEGAAP